MPGSTFSFLEVLFIQPRRSAWISKVYSPFDLEIVASVLTKSGGKCAALLKPTASAALLVATDFLVTAPLAFFVDLFVLQPSGVLASRNSTGISRTWMILDTVVQNREVAVEATMLWLGE
jgi:hypothetical protein